MRAGRCCKARSPFVWITCVECTLSTPLKIKAKTFGPGGGLGIGFSTAFGLHSNLYNNYGNYGNGHEYASNGYYRPFPYYTPGISNFAAYPGYQNYRNPYQSYLNGYHSYPGYPGYGHGYANQFGGQYTQHHHESGSYGGGGHFFG
uniref:Uncharacterized protein n=1 Tax=Glossina austeni TaxID=7395 RepID=A0A1A9V2K4_GLOAU